MDFEEGRTSPVEVVQERVEVEESMETMWLEAYKIRVNNEIPITSLELSKGS